MSYTTKIKNEISEVIYSKPEMIAELSGFVRNNGTLNNKILELSTENPVTAKMIVKFIEDIYKEKVKTDIREYLNFTKKKQYFLRIINKVDYILEDLGFLNKQGKPLNIAPEYIVSGNEEVRAYLRGVFLSQGSVNDPKTSQYHMEMLITKPDEAVFVQKLMNIFDLNAKILTRDKGYMVYLKEAEKISDFLKILGVNKAVMYFEDIRIYHDKKNQANRLNNCEQANMEKVFDAAAQQLKYIEIIEHNMGKNLLDDKTKEALEYRKKYPEASLKELSEIISMETRKQLTKSGLNHRFRKIKELAEKFGKMK